MSPPTGQNSDQINVHIALKKCERRYEELLKAVTDYTYTVTIENGVAVDTVHSVTCIGVTGFSSEEYEKNPFLWLEMIFEEDRDIALQQISEILAGQEFSVIEHRIYHKDGSIRWMQNTLLRRYDDNNNLIAYDGLIRDITERKETEENILHHAEELERVNNELQNEIISRQSAEFQLRNSENKLKNIFHTSIPICITDKDYQIILSNDAYKNIFELNERSSASVKCYESRPGPACQTDACPLKRILSGEKEVICEPVKNNPDGRKQYYIVTAKPFLGDTGQLEGIIECFQDITERKNIEIERDRLIVELQKALEEVKTLRGILPICSFCKSIRNDEGYYEQLEGYIHKHSGVDFSHTVCPKCLKKHYPEKYSSIIDGTEE